MSGTYLRLLSIGVLVVVPALGGCEDNKTERKRAKVVNPGQPAAPVEQAAMAPDAEYGRELYMASCASCHGAAGHGLPHQGAELRRAKFVKNSSDAELIELIRRGRQPNDPGSVMKLLMPPRGNPAADEHHLPHIVAFLRTLQEQAAAEDGDSQQAATE